MLLYDPIIYYCIYIIYIVLIYYLFFIIHNLLLLQGRPQYIISVVFNFSSLPISLRHTFNKRIK